MPDVQMLEVKQERFRLAQGKKANDSRLVESASEADADKEADAREVCLNRYVNVEYLGTIPAWLLVVDTLY